MDAHEIGPAVIGTVEMCEVGAVRIGAACADEYGFYGGVVVGRGFGAEIDGECVADGDAGFWRGMMVGGCA